jgi:hypothetical protein
VGLRDRAVERAAVRQLPVDPRLVTADDGVELADRACRDRRHFLEAVQERFQTVVAVVRDRGRSDGGGPEDRYGHGQLQPELHSRTSSP